MKLIDADQCVEEVKKFDSTFFKRELKGYENIFNQILTDIKNTPKVDAISIEWINEYLHKWVDFDPKLRHFRNFVEEMIISWRQEND